MSTTSRCTLSFFKNSTIFCNYLVSIWHKFFWYTEEKTTINMLCNSRDVLSHKYWEKKSCLWNFQTLNFYIFLSADEEKLYQTCWMSIYLNSEFWIRPHIMWNPIDLVPSCWQMSSTQISCVSIVIWTMAHLLLVDQFLQFFKIAFPPIYLG